MDLFNNLLVGDVRDLVRGMLATRDRIHLAQTCRALAQEDKDTCAPIPLVQNIFRFMSLEEGREACFRDNARNLFDFLCCGRASPTLAWLDSLPYHNEKAPMDFFNTNHPVMLWAADKCGDHIVRLYVYFRLDVVNAQVVTEFDHYCPFGDVHVMLEGKPTSTRSQSLAAAFSVFESAITKIRTIQMSCID
jgi:hypothetical protein